MSESSFWAAVSRNMRKYGDFIRIENAVGVGTPDVNYALNNGSGEGWIELKCIPKWPARPDTPVVIKHYTQEQRIWHMHRARYGNVYVLIRVDETREYLMLDAAVAAKLIGTATKAQILSQCLVHGQGTFPHCEVYEELKAWQGRRKSA
jgi:hypothetical protein